MFIDRVLYRQSLSYSLIPPHPINFPVSSVLNYCTSFITMALDRLKSVAQHVTGIAIPHPFDPLSNTEIETVVQIVRQAKGQLAYNAVTLLEPRKSDMLLWLANTSSKRPARVADVVAIAPTGKVVEGWVDLSAKKIVKWDTLDDVQPLVSSTIP